MKARIARYLYLLLLICMIIKIPTSQVMAFSTEDAEETNLPNDKYFFRQWGLFNNGSFKLPDSMADSSIDAEENIDIRALNAWDLYCSDKEIIVAIIDTGIDYTHPDLENRIWINKNEIPDNGKDDDKNGYIDDIYGWNFYNNNGTICNFGPKGRSIDSDNDDHGTHCAGIIAATPNNKIGVAGTASNINVKIMCLKVVGGKNRQGETYDIMKAIEYAEQMGASICNISLNSTDNTSAFKDAFQSSDMLFVCSSGNNDNGGRNNDVNKTFPCSFQLPNVITVSAIQSDGTLADYSNYGVTSVSLAAPGTDIYSTQVGGTYGFSSGTSMAAPFVSGVAAMIYSINDDLYAKEVKAILEKSVYKRRDLKNVVKTGGIIDASAAVRNTKSYVHNIDTKPPSIKSSYSKKNNKYILQVQPSDKGSSGLKLVRYSMGKKNASYFSKGIHGKIFTNNKAVLNKNGVYTIYALDHAGNETIKVLSIKK